MFICRPISPFACQHFYATPDSINFVIQPNTTSFYKASFEGSPSIGQKSYERIYVATFSISQTT